jgi:DNA-binding LytR/AlgR family response regulator
MNCLIAEDEKVAAERLVGLIKKYDPSIDISEIVQSVKNAVQWLNTHQSPDLIFMDIQLADGLSFEIFEQTIVKTPVIFTTAYDEYALKAFKVNSIDSFSWMRI